MKSFPVSGGREWAAAARAEFLQGRGQGRVWGEVRGGDRGDRAGVFGEKHGGEIVETAQVCLGRSMGGRSWRPPRWASVVI